MAMPPNEPVETAAQARERKRKEAKAARLLAIIFGVMMVLMVGGMLVFDIYSERAIGNTQNAPADAAGR